MAAGDDAIRPLREALAASPDNVPLRRIIAQTLATFGRHSEAEGEYREAIRRAPGDVTLKAGLADVYLRQGHTSKSIVILEDLCKGSACSPAHRLLYARALLRSGDPERARHQYRQAIDADPSVADPSLAESLGAPSHGRTGPEALDLHAVHEDPNDDDHGGDDEPEKVRSQQREPSPSIEIERPRTTFADVGGMDKVKDEIRLKIIHPLSHPELYKAYGKKAGGGILMYGPPGCGKTHLARATAGEVKARFLAVGISDVLNMWLGESERNLHELFEQARANRPCVLFFDEVDALGASRSDLRQSAGRQLVNQFLSELDGVDTDNENVLILAATNAPWHIDSAFRRPGRFDRIIFVPPPDEPARASILKLLVAGKPTEHLDFDSLAKKTDGFSGADLKSLIDIAIEGKLREAMTTGVAEPLRTKDLAAAAKSIRPSAKEWFSTAKNHALYANQGGLYDPVLDHLKMR